MEIREQQELAKKINAVIGEGKLNWLGNYNYVLKRKQVNFFFFKIISSNGLS